jgi:hypothetical protein
LLRELKPDLNQLAKRQANQDLRARIAIIDPEEIQNIRQLHQEIKRNDRFVI